jgi:hypothetical protein
MIATGVSKLFYWAHNQTVPNLLGSTGQTAMSYDCFSRMFFIIIICCVFFWLEIYSILLLLYFTVTQITAFG